MVGRDFLRRVNPRYTEELLGNMDMDKHELVQVVNSGKSAELQVQQLVEKYGELFRDLIGC